MGEKKFSFAISELSRHGCRRVRLGQNFPTRRRPCGGGPLGSRGDGCRRACRPVEVGRRIDGELSFGCPVAPRGSNMIFPYLRLAAVFPPESKFLISRPLPPRLPHDDVGPVTRMSMLRARFGPRTSSIHSPPSAAVWPYGSSATLLYTCRRTRSAKEERDRAAGILIVALRRTCAR